REVANRNLRSFEELEAITQRLQVLQDYIFSQRSEETSRNGMILSIVAAIFLPLGFLTGLFGVNIAGMPGMEWPWAFTVLTGISVVIGIALYFLFRVLRWF
ncbi:MAG: zinc transporter ZntB, partial [Paracoccaceae bacterium]|nr:zinc transporter ZntB [Paracoccaceae bacterium]